MFAEPLLQERVVDVALGTGLHQLPVWLWGCKGINQLQRPALRPVSPVEGRLHRGVGCTERDSVGLAGHQRATGFGV